MTERTINITLPDIKLFPPNLQVQVDRQYEVDKGLTAGETRHYRVGSEGAALTSDQYVSIHTQWLNHDGTALPSELPGYTGRLANLVGDGQLNQSSANHFSIAPGKHTEVIKLPNPALSTTAAHQYLHVVGRDFNAMPDKPDFGAYPGSEFPERPGKFVPIKVAVFDKEAGEQLQKSQQALELNGVKQDSSVYRWVYRPEMQYSVFELDIEQIQGIQTDDEGKEQTRDLTEATTPVLAGTDGALQIMQRLLGSDYDPLSLFGSDESLLLEFEGYEQSVSATSRYDTDEPWHFSDLGHLGSLNSEDFLSLNLLKNSDAGNVLWEWAFESLSIDSVLLDEEMLADDGTLIISADELPLPIRAIRFGSERDQSKPHMMTWKVIEGDAQISEGARQSDEGSGQWLATLDIDKVADNEVVLQGWLDDDGSSASTMRRVLVTPGQAHEVTITTTGQPYMAGFGQAEVLIHVQDRHGNNVADGTPVSLNISDSGLIKFSQLSTVSGMAKAVVVGGDNPAIGATLTATALGADTPGTAILDILPLELSIRGLEGTNFRGDQSEIVATVSAGGVPAPGIDVDMVATHGLVEDYTKQTNARGQVVVPLLHLRPGQDARLMVSVGVSLHQQIDYTVQYRAPQTDEQVIESVETMVLGDQTSSGVFSHERFDGTSIPYDFATRSPFAVQGQPNEQLMVTLGDLSDPNLAPMAAWNMSDLEELPPAIVTHEATLAPADVEPIAVDAQQLAPVNGFAMNIALTAADEPAADSQQIPTDEGPTVLLDMAGAYRMVREEDGSASLEVNTSAGTYTLESNAVLTGSHRIEVNLSDGLLSFQIDEEREERELRDAVLLYQSTDSNSEQHNYMLTAPIDYQLAISDLTFSTPAQTPTPNGNAVDETTLHTATTTDVQIIKDHPMGVGSSYRMNTGGAFSAPRTQSTASDNALGFRIDINVPDELQNTDTDTLMDLDGALQLGVTAQGKLQLSVTTTTGTQTLTSTRDYTPSTGPVGPESIGEGTLSPGRWHTVAARFFNGTLTLSVDGIIDEISVDGTLEYSDSGRYTLNAPTQVVHYNSFRLYDWNTEPLLSLLDEASGLLPLADAANSDGSNPTDTQQVQLDSTGRATLFIASRGHLNDQQAGSALRMLRVATSSDNGRDTVSVISSEHYQSMLGFYLEHVAKDTPTLLQDQQGSLPGTMMIGALNYLIPPAEAFFGGLAWGALNFLIPIEDVGILIQQLYYLAANDPDFSMSELVGSALGTLTIIPIAKPLKPVIPGLKAFMKIGSRIKPRFFENAAGPLGRAVKQAFRGKTDSLLLWLPMIYVMGEMALDAESREALLFMINTIKSENDLQTWVEYLAMPTGGWSGAGTPVSSASSASGNDDQAVLDFFIGSANAATKKVQGVRIGAAKLTKTIQRVKTQGSIDADDFHELLSGIRAVTKGLRSVDAGDLRRVAHSSQLIKGTVGLGGAGLSKVIRNARSLRLPPVVLLTVIAYLESRRACDSDELDGIFTNCRKFPDGITEKLDGKYTTLLTRLATTTRKSAGQHGAVFHLAMLAYMQFEFEFRLSELRPIDQEKKVTVLFQMSKVTKPKPFDRVIDIELKKGKDDNDDTATWVEVKSYVGRNLRASPWSWTTKRTGAHREFSIDCQARRLPEVQNESFRWWYQDFDRKHGGQPGPTATQMSSLNKKLHVRPKGFKNTEFGGGGRICDGPAFPKAKLFKIQQELLKSTLRAVMFDGIDNALLDELSLI